jgi:5'-nucleotidase
MTRLLPGAAAFTAAMLVALTGLYASAEAPGDPAERPGVVKLRLLGVNDFHGHLEPPRPGIGGAAWLGAHLDRASVPERTIRVHAGDMVGASPLLSSWFKDEPTIEAANRMGFDVGTVGNHEFDEGGDELLRLLRLARFPYIAANTRLREGGGLLLPPYEIVERAGVRVGFIGVTTPSTPKFLLDRHAERFRFTDISEAVNAWVPELRGRGVEAIVVLAHAGGPTQDESDAPGFVGEIVDETREMSSAVDVVIAGHSHSHLDLRVPNTDGSGDKLVIEALSYGVAYDLVDLSVDVRSGEVVAKSGRVAGTEHSEVSADAELAALVEGYRSRLAPVADRVVGTAGGALTRGGDELGQLVADGERAFARTDAAVVSPGALRADIDAGPITYAELATALAYDHPVMRFTMTGRELGALASGDTYYAGPAELDPKAAYTVAASELLVARGRPVGTEVEAVDWYLARRGSVPAAPAG